MNQRKKRWLRQTRTRSFLAEKQKQMVQKMNCTETEKSERSKWKSLNHMNFMLKLTIQKLKFCSTNRNPFVWNVGSEINMFKWYCSRCLGSFKTLVNWNMALTTHIPWYIETLELIKTTIKKGRTTKLFTLNIFATTIRDVFNICLSSQQSKEH